MAHGFKTGGREQGTPNKITAQVREMITEFVEGNFIVQKLTEHSTALKAA